MQKIIEYFFVVVAVAWLGFCLAALGLLFESKL